MDWAERKQYYNEYFFTKKCAHVCDDGTISYWPPLEAFCKHFLEVYDIKSILDCGCATGIWLKAFYKVAPLLDLVGFELSEYAVANAHPEIKEKILLLDAALEKLPFESKHFDLTIAIEFFEHQDDEHIDFVIENIANVTGKYMLVRQPFIKFNLDKDKILDFLITFNHLKHNDRVKLVNSIPELCDTKPDPNDLYHPNERSFDYVIAKFRNHGFEVTQLPEEFYVLPNSAWISSFTTLFLERVA